VESTDDQLIERIYSRMTMIPSDVLRKGGHGVLEINQDRANKLCMAKDTMDEKYGDRLCFITVPQKTKVTDVLALVDRKRRTVPFDILIVDYLDVIDSVEKYPSRPDLEIGDVSVRLQSFGKRRGLTVITAQSFNNEMIKAIKKQKESMPDGDVKDYEQVVGLEGIGGTQKLSRDADYIWGLIMGNQGLKLGVYWLKSRHTSKEAHFVLNATLDCCYLVDEASSSGGTGPDLSRQEEIVEIGLDELSLDIDNVQTIVSPVDEKDSTSSEVDVSVESDAEDATEAKCEFEEAAEASEEVNGFANSED